MAYVKSPTYTARTTNNDVELTFFVRDGALRVRLVIHSDGPGGAVEAESVEAAISAATSLTAQEKADLQTMLIKLRDEGLLLLGFAEV